MYPGSTSAKWLFSKEKATLYELTQGHVYSGFALGSAPQSGWPAPLRVCRIENNSSRSAISVANSGSRPGSDVVQVYVGEPADADEPPSQLKGFAKVSLQPGERQQLTIAIPVKSLSAWSERDHAWRLAAGTYEFKVGESSRDFRLHGQLQLQ